MLENNNLSYTSQNHSSVTILKHFVYRWEMNILHIISHDLILAIFINAGFINNLSSKSTKILNIHRYNVGAKHCSHKVDLDDIAGRAQGKKKFSVF